jgi:hypothetical protein
LNLQWDRETEGVVGCLAGELGDIVSFIGIRSLTGLPVSVFPLMSMRTRTLGTPTSSRSRIAQLDEVPDRRSA